MAWKYAFQIAPLPPVDPEMFRPTLFSWSVKNGGTPLFDAHLANDGRIWVRIADNWSHGGTIRWLNADETTHSLANEMAELLEMDRTVARLRMQASDN